MRNYDYSITADMVKSKLYKLKMHKAPGVDYWILLKKDATGAVGGHFGNTS